jgi:hypothetical protein
LEVKIDPTDGDKLLKKYSFRYRYNSIDLKGQEQAEHLWQSGNSWYYLEMEGPLWLSVPVLKHDKKSVQILEIFEG